jgi:3-hydroxyisobutyrate dehydrogenase-like beta-hydroxyacid dehydrogenase
MQKYPRIGFVGFGEAGFHIAKGLREAGVERLAAYDINAQTPKLGERIRQRADETGTELAASSQSLASASDVILCVVTANAAAEAAAQTAPYLEGRHLYADCNSVSPAIKQAIDRIITASGAGFVEAALMAPVPPHGHRVPILLGGGAAPLFAEAMSPLGMRLEIVSSGVGTAAATKMFRSVVVKGLEALLFECVMGASRYGAEQRVFASLAESFPGINWSELANYMIGRIVVHGERRAREMEEVAATLESIGIEPLMAAATAERMDWAAKLGLRAHFGGEAPENYRDVMLAIAQATRQESSVA